MTEQPRRPRRQLLAAAAGAVLVVLVAVVVGLASRDSGQHMSVDAATGLRVHDRAGSAVQLSAKSAPIAKSDSAAEAAVARGEQTFTLALLRHADAGAQNVVLSPSSLAIALAMLQNGAAGTTRTQIAGVLQTSGLTAALQNAGWATLTADLAGAKGVTVQSANSLWLQRGLQMRPAFMTALAQYYDTGVWQVDFAHDFGAATDAINSWVKDHTDGKITKLFDQGDIDPSTLLVLADAVYFDAAWKYQFDPKQTTDGLFHAVGGATQVPFMSYRGPLSLSADATYQAAQLPYAGGRFAALVVMPLHQSLSDFVAGLTPSRLAQIAQTHSLANRAVRLPKFTAQSYTRLNGALAAMGMPTAFTDGADFSALSARSLKVQTVAQRAYLKVDENGTRAAAVTGVGLEPTLAMPGLTFDHPFLFLVRDTQSGAILFAAQIQNPAH